MGVVELRRIELLTSAAGLQCSKKRMAEFRAFSIFNVSNFDANRLICNTDAVPLEFIRAPHDATPTNVQSIFGEPMNSATNTDPEAARPTMPLVMEWLAGYTLALGLIGETFANHNRG